MIRKREPQPRPGARGVEKVGGGGPGGIGRTLSGWPYADPASGDSRLMARFLGAMVVAAATLALVWVVLPSPPESDRTAIAVLAVGTEAAGLLLLSGLLDAQPRVVFEFAVALGTAVVSLGDYLARVRGTGLPLLYLWAVPYSFWYFPWRRAAIQAGLVVAGFAAASLAASAAHPALAGRPSSDWGPVLLMAGTAVIVGEFVRRLRLAVAESHRRFARIFVSAPTPM